MLVDFEQKLLKLGRISGKFVFLFLFFLVLGKYKKNYSFPNHTDKDIFFLQPRCLQKVRISGADFFSSAAEFFRWTGRKSSARSFQH
jgi:hypothetical protein